MNFYPQLLLWTYVLLPAISLLLTPTFIIVLARAQQQRAKIMMNALTARGRAAAAVARNQQRRYIPNNRYLNGFGQNKLLNFRSKRQIEMGVHDIMPPLVENPIEPDTFARTTHWDQQEEALGQLANMWNMNNFGNTQIDDVIRSRQDQPKIVMEDRVGEPFIYNHKNQHNDGKSDYYSGAFSGRNVFDEVLEQRDPLALVQNENGAQFIEDRAADPEPTLKHKKKKFGIKQDPYPQSYYNSYYPQHSYPSSYYRSSDLADTSRNIPLEANDMERVTNGNPLNVDERLGNPEPTFKKKKLKKKLEPYPQNYYNSYYPENSYGNSYNLYGRSDQDEGIPQNDPFGTDDITGLIEGDPTNTDERLRSPKPTLKKLKKKILNKHKPYPYPPSYYSSYYPQYSHSNTYNNPYSRSAELEYVPQNLPMTDDKPLINGEQLLQNMEPKSAHPDPTIKRKKFGKKPQMEYSYFPSQNNYNSYSNSHYSPYSREAETQKMHQNIQEHAMDDFMMSELVAPRFADPEPTFKKKKTKKIEHMPSSFYYPPKPYYPDNQYIYYYPANSYSNSNYNRYARSAPTEIANHNDAMERSTVIIEKVGEENPFEEEKSAEPNHDHQIKIEKENGDDENLLNSSNFYEKDNKEDGESNGVNMSKKEINTDLPAIINGADEKQKITEELQNSDDSPSKNSPQRSRNNPNTQVNPEEVGCELDEKIEKKLQKKINKLLYTDVKKDEKQIDYPYPPMYPPLHNYEAEYEQPEYYRSASETDQVDETNKGEELKSSEEHFSEPVNKFERDVVLKEDFGKKMLPDDLSQQPALLSSPTPNQESIPTTGFHQNMVNSRSSVAGDQTYVQPEEVGCELDDKLFESNSPTKTFDPYAYYQRAVEGISEEGKKIAEETKKMLHPAEQQPATPVKPKLTYVDIDEISKNDYQPLEQAHSDLIYTSSDEHSTPFEEKSANPNANPTHHSRGFTHTHSHFSSHTHGHTHGKTIGAHHGAHSLHSVTPNTSPTQHHSQVVPHQQVFSQANAKAQTFNHGGVQHSVAHANSNSFGSGFGSNIATAQSGAQTFNNGQINGFGSTGPQTFPNDGFGQSAASSGSLVHRGDQINNFGLNRGFASSEAQAQSGQINGFGSGGAITQSGAQTLNQGGFAQAAASAGSITQNRPAFNPTISQPTFNNGGFGQATASTGSIIQNGPTFVPNAAIPQPIFNHGGFGQSTAHASAQAGVTEFNGVQNFGNGFQNTQPLIFNNNPSQFASSSANAQIVGEPREAFVMPYLDEIPVHDLMSKMEFDNHRFSRTPQDFQDSFNGLELASSIVHASLNKDSFSNDNAEEKLGDEFENTKKTMGFVTDIVDSSVKAGENVNQNYDVVKAPNSGAATHLTLQGISSITDLVSKGLRIKRQAMIKDNDFQNNKQVILDNNRNGTELTQDVQRNLFVDPIGSVETTSMDVKVLKDQRPDSLLQTSNKTNEKEDKNVSENHKKIIIQALDTIRSENSGIKNKVYEVPTLEIEGPDSFTPTPKLGTSGPSTANLNHETDEVIHVTPVLKDIFIKDKEDSTFDGANLDTTTENLIKTSPVGYKQSVNASPEVEDHESVLMTTPATESYNVAVYDDIIINTSTKSYQSVDLQTQNSKEISKSSAEESQNHTESNLPVDTFLKEYNNGNTTRDTSFLGLEDKDLSMNGNSKISDIEKKQNINLFSKDIPYEPRSTEIPKEISEKILFFPNGTRKNISELTSDEILELQFDLPNNSTETNISNPEYPNSTTEEPILGLALKNDQDFPKEQKNNSQEFRKNDDVKSKDIKSSKKDDANSTNILQGASSNVSDKSSIDFQQHPIQKLMTNMSDSPFASIEAEMSVLTEEEKEEFVRQELELVSQVIEETLNNITYGGATSQKQNTLNLSHGTKTETEKKDSVVASPNIFQDFGRENDREEYSRQALDKTSKETNFDDLLGQQRVKIEKIKNIADEDDDLLMISFIGDSIIKDLEHRRNQTHPKQLNKTMDDTTFINSDNIIDESDALKQTASTSLSNEQNKTNESSTVKIKRAIRGVRSSRAPLTQLMTDPTMKLNVGKTLQNLGSIARHTFENPKAPMYHVRNMLGNAKDSVMSVAKVPPNNFLIPSQYEIAKISKDKYLNGEKVGAVNQNMLLSRSGFADKQDGDKAEELESPSVGANGNSLGMGDTVQKIGVMVKESVQSGKDTLKHVNDIATDAKKILHTSRYAAPRFVLPLPQPVLTSRGSFPPTTSRFKYSPYTPHFNKKTMEPILGAPLPQKSPNRKTVLIAPKIFDIQEKILGHPQEDPDDFVGMGHILDAAGFSQPNQPEVELQQIEYMPPKNRNLKPLILPKKSLMLARNQLPISTSKPLTEDDKEPNENAILGSSQVNNDASQALLPNGEQKADTESLQNFMQRMHDEMKEIVRLQYEGRKRMRQERISKPQTSVYYNKKQDYINYNKNKYDNYKKNYYENKKTARETLKSTRKANEGSSPMLKNFQSFSNLRNYNDENVERPSEATKIFPKTLQSAPNRYSMKENNDEEKLGTGVPTIYSRIKESPSNMDISLPVTSYAEKYPYQYLKSQKNLDSTNDEEKVGLFLPENLMKPFMGEPTETLINDYMLQNGDEEVIKRESSSNFKKIPEVPKILLPKLQPFSHVNNVAPKSYDLKKLAPLPNWSFTPVDLVPELQPLLSPNPTSVSTLKSDIVGTSLSKKIVNKTNATNSSEIEEKTKEFVELLSDPEIEDSEEKMEMTTSKLLDSIAQDNDVVKPSSVVKQPNNEQIINAYTTTENDAEIQNTKKSNSEADAKKKNIVRPKLVVEKPNIELLSTLKPPTVPSVLKEPSKIVKTPTTSSIVKNDDDNIEKSKNAYLIDNVKQTSSLDNKRNPLIMGHIPDDNDLGYVLGAINPMMFERHFNERLKINDTSSKDTHNKFLKHGVIKEGGYNSVDEAKLGSQGEGKSKLFNEDEEPKDLSKTYRQKSYENLNQNKDKNVGIVDAKDSEPENNEQVKETNDQGRTSMNIIGPYRKPFMGHIKTDEMNNFLNQYNNHLPVEHDGEEKDEYTPDDIKQENIDPVKKVIFSSLDNEEKYENYGY